MKIPRELANTPAQSGKGDKPQGFLYVLDEPTRGLRLEDMNRLLAVLGQLVDEEFTVLMVEHHLDVIKCADWVIDLGPGGHNVAQGPPEDVAKNSAPSPGSI
ncbi:MAG: hypothetical protein AB7T38_04100 [Nitrospirales bacterium]